MILTQVIRDHLWSAPEVDPRDAEARSMRVHVRAMQIVRLYYVVSLLWVAQVIRGWQDLRDSTVIDPQWPGEWIKLFELRTGITAILLLYTFGAIAAAALPRYRLIRIAYFVGLLMYLALDNGFGKIGHGFHGWLWVSAFLILLPGDRSTWGPTPTRDQRQTFLQVIMLAQMCVLFFYTLTGIWKIYFATTALFGPGVSGFELNGFSLLIGKNLLESGRDTLLGEMFVEYPVVGWALYTGTMYLEAMSLLIVFRPRLHRFWGFGLIMFHLGTQVAMGINFPANIVLLGLLFLCSPLAPETLDLKATFLDLPGVRLLHRSRQRWAKPKTPLAPATAA